METSKSAKRRVFRGKLAILELLRHHRQSGLSIQAFCDQHSIPTGSFHNWKKRYSTNDNRVAEQSFTTLQIQPGVSQQLFAEVGCIKLFQPVSAVYLKELAS
jgi:hypothetical protein